LALPFLFYEITITVNPRTGEAVKIAAKFTPKFKPARAFKEAVQ